MIEDLGVLDAGGGAEEPVPVEAEGSQPLGRLSPEDLRRGIEAVLFSAGEPVGIRQLSELFECPVHDVREAVEDLRLEYVTSNRSFRLEDIASGMQILTVGRWEPWIRRYLSRALEGRLSPAALETLAVIAYRQPITKASLEGIRGVQCAPILKTLLDRSLVKVVGREDSLGRPLLYGTTKRFLETFGLSSLTGLPQPELETPSAGPPSASPAAPPAGAALPAEAEEAADPADGAPEGAETAEAAGAEST